MDRPENGCYSSAMQQHVPPHKAIVGAHDAKTHLARLLDRVERGEEIVITRHGRPVARLVPNDPGHDVAAARSAAAGLVQARDQLAADGLGPFTLDDLLSARDEGRRF
jgi:prevent-host-death family protein